MNVYRAKEHDVTGIPRAHPWTTASKDPACRYVDFRSEPEKIPTSLEDFIRWKQYPAIECFYDFLRWVNGPESLLESNDCAFSLEPNNDPNRPFQLQASGRVMLFVADLRFTCSHEFGECLMGAFGSHLARNLPQSSPATVGVSKATSFFKAVGKRGEQAVLYFWAWGDSEPSTFSTLGALFEHMLDAAKGVSREIQEAISLSECQSSESPISADNS
jgi:hypothetical protein